MRLGWTEVVTLGLSKSSYYPGKRLSTLQAESHAPGPITVRTHEVYGCCGKPFQANGQRTGSSLEERWLIRVRPLQVLGNLPTVIHAFPFMILINYDGNLHMSRYAAAQ